MRRSAQTTLAMLLLAAAPSLAASPYPSQTSDATFVVADATPAAPAEAVPAPTAAGGGNPDLASGHEMFNTTCSHCHGADGVQAIKKVNLRLLNQRYGDKAREVFTATVTNGRVSKGMPAWSAVFSEDDVSKIYLFLESVQEKE